MSRPQHIQIVEVGPRDGLQNEDVVLSAAVKAELIMRCMRMGATRIEVASFVNPKRVPQMADAEEVLAAVGPAPDGVAHIGLVLNERGLERALATTIDEVNLVVGASAAFNRANAGAAPEATMTEIEAMLPRARAAGLATTVTISVAFGCPYEGAVAPEAVVALAKRAARAGADEIALGDTIGVAVPDDVRVLVSAVRSVANGAALRCHFHDTRNTAIANVSAAIEAGVGVIDAAVGGAGGCPFAPNATGNVATEDVVYLLGRSGLTTGVDLEATIATGRWLGSRLGTQLPAALGRAGGFPGSQTDG